MIIILNIYSAEGAKTNLNIAIIFSKQLIIIN